MRLVMFLIRTRFYCYLLIAIMGLPGMVLGQALTNLNLSLVSNVKPSASPLSYGDVWAEGDLACLGVWLGYSSYNYGVGIYSISNPAAPVLLSVYSPAPTAHNQFELGALRDRIGYFGSWSSSGGGGLHIVSLTNPASPQLLCRIGATTGNVTNGFDRVHTLFLERNYLYEAAHVPGITTVKVFDVSNPSMPVFLQNIQTTNTTKVHQITVRNKGGQVILYTSGWGGNSDGNPNSPGQTDIWDVTAVGSQPAQWLGRVYSGYNSHSSWPTDDGNTLIVCRETPGGDVKFFDISNPAAIPTNAVPFITLTPANMGLEADIPHNPVVAGNFLFLSWYQNGIQVFDISDVTRPVRVGFYDTFPGAQTSSYQGNWGVMPFLGFDKILLSDIQRGLFILDGSALLTPANNYPPLIAVQPASLTATQGLSAAFTPTVTGSSLTYQWRFNGAAIPGATSSNLVFADVQAANAGTYQLVVSNATGVLTSSVASLSVLTPQSSQTVFYENFDSAASSNNWDLFQGSANGTPDYAVDWSFDYGTYFSSFNGTTIPPAPHTTNGMTRGVKLNVNNNDGVGATVGVSLYPKNQFFSGAYSLRFDMWINYPGGPGGSGSSGSTEHFTAGINHAGTRVNWESVTANPSDGVWFAMDGEGGTTTDYRTYVGNAAASPTLLSFANSGLSASGASSGANTDSIWLGMFPSPVYESPGAPGKRWTQVEISQAVNNVVTWRMNGQIIAQRVNTSEFTNGNIMIGYMDIFASVALPAVDAFVVFDNVRVDVTSPPTSPVITAHPQDVSVYPESDAIFSVAATGAGPLTYQWLFNGGIIPGATNNSYTRQHVQPEEVGNYSVVVSNTMGSVTSSNALLLLLDSPYLSAVQAVPGSHSALISWNSTVAGDSQVQFSLASGQSAAGQGSFGSSSYIDPAITTNHIILLTGLSPGTRYSYQTLARAGTNTYLSGVYQFTTAGTNVIDNPEATFTGEWTEASSSGDKYSTNYRFATTVPGAATATATWRPNIVTSGRYDVFVWYPEGGNRANNAPYLVSFSGGSTTVPVNQQTGGGAWQLIASGVEFARGTNGFVRLSNDAGPTVVIADAVRFVYVEAQDFPTGPTIPVWWRDFFFGGETDTGLDTDSDGYTTAQEYVMGTTPTNALSRLQMSATGNNTDATVTIWPAHGNRSYHLLSRPEIGMPVWEPVSAGMTPAPDGSGVFNLSSTNAPQNFYRLKVQMSASNSVNSSFSLPANFLTAPLVIEEYCGPFRIYVR